MIEDKKKDLLQQEPERNKESSQTEQSGERENVKSDSDDV